MRTCSCERQLADHIPIYWLIEIISEYTHDENGSLAGFGMDIIHSTPDPAIYASIGVRLVTDRIFSLDIRVASKAVNGKMKCMIGVGSSDQVTFPQIDDTPFVWKTRVDSYDDATQMVLKLIHDANAEDYSKFWWQFNSTLSMLPESLEAFNDGKNRVCDSMRDRIIHWVSHPVDKSDLSSATGSMAAS